MHGWIKAEAVVQTDCCRGGSRVFHIAACTRAPLAVHTADSAYNNRRMHVMFAYAAAMAKWCSWRHAHSCRPRTAAAQQCMRPRPLT